MNIWLKVTLDKYELPVAVADTAEELAKLCGVKVNSIYCTKAHAAAKGQRSSYVLVMVDEEDNDGD